ncbi:hypothetical protein BUALT_Bualt10G0031700 [Buddleja alternifolia]|uniref:Uncharacterized protein n=1 Tax=Buddleja alternifolia TaxID=168488 RepID=A0AAV6WXG6_9LAMI|nr:hypothetical protein BUALT_BualtUnG0002600 [Buddleja alternifolia]KAG8374784.1 hypothetical protein BUALT_Bualt10G0031700 [Buddleja alternifolia]
MKEFLHQKINSRCSWRTGITKLLCIFFLILMISSSCTVVNCSPSIQCAGPVKNTNCTFTNSYGTFPDRGICRAAEAVYPTTDISRRISNQGEDKNESGNAVTLQLQPLFKRSVTFVTKNDFNLGVDAVSFGRLYMVSKSETGFRSTSALVLSTFRTTEETQESLGDVDGKCITGRSTSSTLRMTAYGFTNDDLYNGILIRYVTTSSAYLGKQEDALDFDITYYRSKDALTPRLFEDILEEIEQIAVFKYKALPHCGKNRNVVFQGAIKKYKNADKFIEIKQMYDPLGLFSSDWTDQILGLRDGLNIMKEGCALEGLCICSKDIHCAPNKGYFCRPGKVYKEARVCAKITVSKNLSFLDFDPVDLEQGLMRGVFSKDYQGKHLLGLETELEERLLQPTGVPQ